MKTLAIETSCDDTSLAIVSCDQDWVFRVEDLLAYSQISEHQKFWWVVPELASRLHSEKIIAILQTIGWEKINKVDTISVTTQPWLPGSLVVGKTVAFELWTYFDKRVIPVHHIHGHIFSILLERKLSDIVFPLVILTASGWHNDMYLIERKTEQKSDYSSRFHQEEFAGFIISKLGCTLDDAAGECFDKVSRMLWGPYPGWAWIGQKAKMGRSNPQVKFKRIFLSHDKYEFSFSGMKSQVSFLLEKLKKGGIELTDQLICDIAYEFQEAVVEVMAKKLIQAAQEFWAGSIAIAGWVSANQRLSEVIEEINKKKNLNFPFFSPVKIVYSTDNWAMIGVAGLLQTIS